MNMRRKHWKQLGKPSHIDEIVAKVVENNPGFVPSVNGMKAAMQKTKERFIFFGRSSTFGLKKWELLSEYIKGGTIRDIVEEYLGGVEQPCHISEIAKHVMKFRKTDEVSIITNLKMTVEKRFIFFKNGMVGLASKNYEGKEAQTTMSERISIDDLMLSIFSK